jgi:flagellar hook-associated protein 3 FlgL
LQDFRDLLLQAGNGSYDQVARDALVQQMQSLRDQVLGYANAKDSNGLPIFRGLGSPDTPLQSTPPGSSSQLNPGQNTGSDNGLPISLDGHAAWLNVPTGNGVFVVNSGLQLRQGLGGCGIGHRPEQGHGRQLHPGVHQGSDYR